MFSESFNTYAKDDITMNDMAVVSVNDKNYEAKDQRKQNHDVINIANEDIKNFPGLLIPKIHDAGMSERNDVKMDIDNDLSCSSRSWSIVRIKKE